MKNITIVIIIFILGIGVYIFVNNQTELEKQPTINKTQYNNTDFQWVIEKAESWEDTMPHQVVSLRYGNNVSEIGVYMNCIDNSVGPAAQNPIYEMQCWWAGGGHQLQLIKNENLYQVQVRTVSEVPPGVEAEPYGYWDTVLEI